MSHSRRAEGAGSGATLSGRPDMSPSCSPLVCAWKGWIVSDSKARAERFEELFAATSRPLLGYALRRSPSPTVAADVVAETMLIAWRRIDDIPRAGLFA